MPIIYGEQGTGKSLIEELFGKFIIGPALFGVYNDISSIIGSFNDCLMNKLYVLVNEFNLDVKHDMGAFKNIITSDVLRINKKYANIEDQVPNYVRLLATTNNLPTNLGLDQRRIIYVKANDKYADKNLKTAPQRKEADLYFQKLRQTMQDGANDIFTYLMNVDTTDLYKKEKPKCNDLIQEISENTKDPFLAFLDEWNWQTTQGECIYLPGTTMTVINEAYLQWRSKRRYMDKPPTISVLGKKIATHEDIIKKTHRGISYYYSKSIEEKRQIHLEIHGLPSKDIIIAEPDDKSESTPS